jgi:methionyl aminopeptidase
MILIKTPEEIALMAAGGKRHAEILQAVVAAVRVGITTAELDAIAHQMVLEGGDTPAFLGYQPYGADFPFPATLCISINDEIVHGIPGGRIVQDGDVVSIDLGLIHQGMVTDAAVTVLVGDVNPEAAAMLETAQRALLAGIAMAVPGNHIGDISAAIQETIGSKYGIVRDLAGHGVGRHIHEDPYVPNYGVAGTGELIRAGMTIAIEPMITLGKPAMKTLADGYTISTKDGSIAVHTEHTIAITDQGPIILTI